MTHVWVARLTVVVVLLHAALAARGAAAGSGDPPGSGRLGKYGDLRKRSIEGAAAIPTDALRNTLAKDWAMQVLLAPSAPIENSMPSSPTARETRISTAAFRRPRCSPVHVRRNSLREIADGGAMPHAL